MRRALAPFCSLAVICSVLGTGALGAHAQVNPPVTPPPAVATAPPGVATPTPTATPAFATPVAPPAVAVPTPTQPPIEVDPPQLAVEPQRRVSARINSALGTVNAAVADPSIAAATVDQAQRMLYVDGLKVGTTTVTLTDGRGVTRDVPVRVAYDAGVPADEIALRVTGDPDGVPFLRDAIGRAVERAAQLQPGAVATVSDDAVAVRAPLAQDDRMQVDVPVSITGDGYLPVNATTRVDVENQALPPIYPTRLLVSDYPERLTADGVLFEAHLDVRTPQRFLYYHYDPGNQPERRILLKVHNPSASAPATVQIISGIAGPESNEMEVGHLSTRRFLVREARNEGTVVTIPANATLNVVDHLLPPKQTVSGLLQLRLVDGVPVDLTLIAQHADAPVDQSIAQTQLLAGGAPHARGIYPVPTFYVERTYDASGPDLEIPIGQLPLPNLRQGEALGGDYGVQQSISIVLFNPTRGPKSVALYANPRGGRATGTFLIDGTLVQAHALPSFSKYKLWQETLGPGTFRRLHVVTMPEGGSSYPLRLIVGQDDGSVAPGAPGSPIY